MCGRGRPDYHQYARMPGVGLSVRIVFFFFFLVRRKAVSSAKRALRCRVWHEIRVDERTDR
eukprot:7154736-Prymnesium_polylepis.1